MDRRWLEEDYLIVGMDTSTWVGRYGAIVTSDLGIAVVLIAFIWAVVTIFYQAVKVLSTADE